MYGTADKRSRLEHDEGRKPSADRFKHFWLTNIGKLVSQSFGSIVQFLVLSIQFISYQVLTKTNQERGPWLKSKLVELMKNMDVHS